MTDEQFDTLTDIDTYETEYVQINRRDQAIGLIQDFLKEAKVDGSEITLADFLENLKETVNG